MKEPVDAAVWERLARRLRYVKIDLTQSDQYSRLRDEGGPGTARDGQLLRRGARPLRPDLPGARSRRAGHGTGQGGAGKAHRHGSRLLPGHQRCGGRCLPRAAGVPHRPLSRQGDGAEPAGAALCQLHLHHQLGPQHHRPRPDHGGRGGRDRGAVGLLRRSPASSATWCRITSCRS